ncbi:MAG: tetratricopeptide repeat protein [Myxococcota bacterium]
MSRNPVRSLSLRDLRHRLSARGIARTALCAVLVFAACGSDVEARLVQVRALQDVGQFQASVPELRQVLALDPEQPEANYRLGVALVQIGEPSRAVWPLQKAASASDYQIPAGVLLASTLFKTGNYDDAIRAADQVLAADPERHAAMRIRANAHLAARRLENALADTSILVERFPEDWTVRGLHATVLGELGRLEAAEREHARVKEIGSKSEDPSLRSRACLAPALFADEVLKDPVRALALYSECAEGRPTDISVLNHLVSFFDRQGDTEPGTNLWRQAVEAAPEKLALRQGLALRLQAVGEPAQAEDVLREAVASFDSAAAWNLLAGFYRARNEPGKALDAIEKVIARGGDADERVQFMRVDVLIDLGELERAREATDELSQATYAQLLRGRIHLMEGEPAEALANFEQGIRAWPNNAAARYLAGIAARDLGDFERASSEFREAVRANNAETDAALELARLLYLQGEYEQAIQFANLARGGRSGPRLPEPYAIAARSMAALGQAERARATLAALERLGLPVDALRERALLARELDGPVASQRALEAGGLDVSLPEHRELLHVSVENQVLSGAAEAALEDVERALAQSKDDPELLGMKGATLQAAGRAEEAEASFDRALALAPDNAPARAGLASLRAEQGQIDAAIELYDAAYAAIPAEGRYGYAAAQLVLRAGPQEAAVERLRALTGRHPGLAEARNDLAWLLASRRESLDEALSLALEARRLGGGNAVLDTLGWVHFQRGEYPDAVAVLEKASAAAPNDASVRYRLARAVAETGDAERARALFAEALRSGPFPESEDAERRLAAAASGS